ISFTGTPLVAGAFNLGIITIKDAAGATVTKTYISITINRSLRFRPVVLLPAVPNVFYSQTIKAIGGTGTLTISYTLSRPLPTGLTITPPSPTTGAVTISGTPRSLGNVTLTFTVTDSVGATATIKYTLVSRKRPSTIVPGKRPSW